MDNAKWPRVIYVVGDGYDCDEMTHGEGFTEDQRKATRFTQENARQRRDIFWDANADAKVVRLRPRSASRGVVAHER